MSTAEQTTFKQGDRVQLEGSERLRGIIIAVYEPGVFSNIKVRWDNGHTGMCFAEDLEHVPNHVRA